MSLVDLLKVSKGLKKTILGTFFLGYLLAPFHSDAKDVTLRWDPSPSKEVVGYKVYYGLSHEHLKDGIDADEGSSGFSVGDVLATSVHGLDDNKNYYFAVTAYDNLGNESIYSNTVMSPSTNMDLESNNGEPIITFMNVFDNSPSTLAVKMQYFDDLSKNITPSNTMSLEFLINTTKVDERIVSNEGLYQYELDKNNLKLGLNTFKMNLTDNDGNSSSKTYVVNSTSFENLDDSQTSQSNSEEQNLDTLLIDFLSPISSNVFELANRNMDNPNFHIDTYQDKTRYNFNLESNLDSYTKDLTPLGLKKFNFDSQKDSMLCMNIQTDQAVKIIPFFKDKTSDRYLSHLNIFLPGNYESCTNINEYRFIPDTNYNKVDLDLESLGLVIKKTDSNSNYPLNVEIRDFRIKEVNR